MITNTIKIVPRYNEVDQMGYVYHANYVSYCHQARTELMRKMDFCDAFLEANGIMMPVISFDIKYKKPTGYDEAIYITAKLSKVPSIRLEIEFEIKNEKGQLLCSAQTMVVFVNSKTRKPMRTPSWIKEKVENELGLLQVN